MAQTGLFVRKQSGGAYTVVEIEQHPGNVWFVDSGHTSAADVAGNGYNPDYPFATIDYAVGQCTASNGDVIYVMPGHTETVSAAAGLDLDVAGISVVGLGNGWNRPKIVLDTDVAADIDIGAANVRLENVIISANFADITAALDVDGDYFTLRKCRFQQEGDNLNFVICVQAGAANTADAMVIEDCEFIAYDAANTHAIDLAAAQNDVIIRRNLFVGDWGTMCIGGAGVVVRAIVTDNMISNAANTNDACINLAAAATGIVMKNLACGAAAQANGITAQGCALAENYYGVVTEDLQAILDPIVT